MSDLFESEESVYLQPRNDLLQMIAILNEVALDPFKEEITPKELIDFIPIRWDLGQLMQLLKILHERQILTNYFAIIVDGKFKIHDAYCLIIEKLKEESPVKSIPLRMVVQNVENTPDNRAFIEKLNDKLQKQESIFLYAQEYMKTKYNLSPIQVIVLPYNFRETIKKAQLPTMNSDLLEFVNAFLELKTFIKNLKQSSWTKYIFSQFDQNNLAVKALTRGVNEWGNINMDKWAKVWVSMLEDLMMNIVITTSHGTENQIMLAFRLIVEEGRITINPLPMSVLKNCCGEGLPNKLIGERVHSKTGLRTLVIDEKQINMLLRHYSEASGDLFDDFAKLLELIYSSPWFPDSLLNSFLKLFGFELGSGIDQVHLSLRAVVKFYKEALIITFQSPFEKAFDGTIVHFSHSAKKYSIKLIDSEPYKPIFQDTQMDSIEKVKKVKELIEKALHIKFGAIFGFDIDVLSDSISAKSIQSMLGINRMTKQLPLIASIGGLFASLKALGIEEQIHSDENPVVQLYKQPAEPKEYLYESMQDDFMMDRMKFVNYFDAFLKKGVICIIDETLDNISQFRSPILSKDGYLGLDLQKMRQLIESQQKEKED